jgi:hypothetical protein
MVNAAVSARHVFMVQATAVRTTTRAPRAERPSECAVDVVVGQPVSMKSNSANEADETNVPRAISRCLTVTYTQRARSLASQPM